MFSQPYTALNLVLAVTRQPKHTQDCRRVPETRRPLAQRRTPQLRPRRQRRRRRRRAGRHPAELGDSALGHPGLWVRARQGERRGVLVLPELEVDGRRPVQMRVLRVSEERGEINKRRSDMCAEFGSVAQGLVKQRILYAASRQALLRSSAK